LAIRNTIKLLQLCQTNVFQALRPEPELLFAQAQKVIKNARRQTHSQSLFENNFTKLAANNDFKVTAQTL